MIKSVGIDLAGIGEHKCVMALPNLLSGYSTMHFFVTFIFNSYVLQLQNPNRTA